MPTIKPISDLRNYSAVLQDVAFGAPVYLTKNGRGCYAIVDIAEQEEYEKTKAALRLMCELEKGRKAGEEQGWLSSDDVREHFRRKSNG
ncbi:type II toxin-antitoxin system prevent-host-death family antitoxin [Ruminococcus sp.]|uniref:type II toxin-antitoxin system prevent-host-death family antitoxin n=1 Tax=Ruminococcus sp. TaxID=41978 RepID=UPI0025E80A7B|nr:type II toxin-antitoxin system prevent-host-death family antitoxin [Ruminococcus sp.]